jgi:hypothetical protein
MVDLVPGAAGSAPHDLADVAEALDVSVGTVASRLNRALTVLRAALEADARLTGNPERRTVR